MDQVHLIILIIRSYKRDQCIVGLMMCKTGMRTVCHLDTKSVKMRMESIRGNSNCILHRVFVVVLNVRSTNRRCSIAHIHSEMEEIMFWDFCYFKIVCHMSFYNKENLTKGY